MAWYTPNHDQICLTITVVEEAIRSGWIENDLIPVVDEVWQPWLYTVVLSLLEHIIVSVRWKVRYCVDDWWYSSSWPCNTDDLWTWTWFLSLYLRRTQWECQSFVSAWIHIHRMSKCQTVVWQRLDVQTTGSVKHGGPFSTRWLRIMLTGFLSVVMDWCSLCCWCCWCRTRCGSAWCWTWFGFFDIPQTYCFSSKLWSFVTSGTVQPLG